MTPVRITRVGDIEQVIDTRFEENSAGMPEGQTEHVVLSTPRKGSETERLRILTARELGLRVYDRG